MIFKMKKIYLVEYIWIDGKNPVQGLRSKSRCIELEDKFEKITINDFPLWNFDGSSTYQAKGGNSDLILQPVSFVIDPLEDNGDYLVMCEVLNHDSTPHISNMRSILSNIMAHKDLRDQDPWVGFEQEYTMFRNKLPLGWPDQGDPAPQGHYYCSIGADRAFGRNIVMQHAHACMKANIIYYGFNAEVMPGQWEFQTGYRGANNGESIDAMTICDHTYFARWLLYRIAENHGINISLDSKPMKGDWNGAGMHVNFSTKDMRQKDIGKETIDNAIELLSKKHAEHIKCYGSKLEERLTGLHETSSIDKFSYGDADRGCSIRIPRMTLIKGYGYLEDRRPGANAEPYKVAARLLATIAKIDIEIE